MQTDDSYSVEAGVDKVLARKRDVHMWGVQHDRGDDDDSPFTRRQHFELAIKQLHTECLRNAQLATDSDVQPLLKFMSCRHSDVNVREADRKLGDSDAVLLHEVRIRYRQKAFTRNSWSLKPAAGAIFSANAVVWIPALPNVSDRVRPRLFGNDHRFSRNWHRDDVGRRWMKDTYQKQDEAHLVDFISSVRRRVSIVWEWIFKWKHVVVVVVVARWWWPETGNRVMTDGGVANNHDASTSYPYVDTVDRIRTTRRDGQVVNQNIRQLIGQRGITVIGRKVKNWTTSLVLRKFREKFGDCGLPKRSEI